MGAAVAQTLVEEAGGTAREQQQYLTFMLGGEVYALGILHIKEIIQHGRVTPMPMMPAFIHGVINLRGRAVPVIDLLSRFGRGTTVVGRRTCIAILEVARGGRREDVGVLVDAVNEVLEIPRSEIEPVPDCGAEVRTEFMEGMGKVNGLFVVILNADRLLSREELETVRTLAGGTAPAARG